MDTAVYDYEKIYFGMWETARRYSELIQFRVIGKSHDDRMIPMVEMGQGEDCIFCVSGIYGYDRLMPVLLLEMIREYARAWECNWKLEEIYDAGELLKKWRFCFIPILNPDGYEIYNKDYFVIRNPIYRQMLRIFLLCHMNLYSTILVMDVNLLNFVFPLLQHFSSAHKYNINNTSWQTYQMIAFYHFAQLDHPLLYRLGKFILSGFHAYAMWLFVKFPT